MKTFKGYIIGLLTGIMLVSVPIFADSYSKTIEALVNFTNVQIDGEPVQSDNFVVDGKTYVWIRDVASMFDNDIIWDEKTNTANIVPKGSYIPDDTESTVVGTVNGIPLTAREAYSSAIMAGAEISDENPLSENIDDIITLKILLSKADENLITSDDVYMNEAKVYVEDAQECYGESFNDILSRLHFTKSEYTKFYADNLKAEDFIKNLRESYTVDEETVKALYEQNMEQYETVTAKHILIQATDDNAMEKADLAEDIYQKLKAGLDFDKLMNEYSEDPGLQSAPDGYTFTRGEMIKEFEDAAFSQEVGKLYRPIKSDYGYHIILVTDHTKKEYDDVKNELTDNLFIAWYAETINNWMDTAIIDIDYDLLNSLYK